MRFPLRITTGIFALVCIVAMLLSFPSAIFVRGVSLIDTELQGSSGKGTLVKIRLDFARPEQMEGIPLNIREWSGTRYDAPKLEKTLGADVALSRAYHHPTSPDPVFFMVIQSKDTSSFHPPPVCYRALGYAIKEGVERFTLTRSPWAGEEWISLERVRWLPEELKSSHRVRINVKKLVVTRREEGKVIDRRIVLYYYVKDEWVSTPKEITLIQVSALAPLNGSDEHILELEKRLIADSFPIMFEPRLPEKTLGKWLVAEGGVLGWIVIVCSATAPIGFVIYPAARKLWVTRFQMPGPR